MATRGFKYDIFISYAHADDATSSGWLKRFLDDLKKELGARLGRGVNIFFDEMHFSANDELISRTLASLQGSAIFMPVVSPAYLKSDWAKAELAAYVELNGSRQILPIETAALEQGELPDALANRQRLRFWSRDDNRVVLRTENDIEYHKLVQQIADQVAKQLGRTSHVPMTYKIESPAPSELAQKTSPPLPSPPIEDQIPRKRVVGGEPSIEDILASIRRAIEDDDASIPACLDEDRHDFSVARLAEGSDHYFSSIACAFEDNELVGARKKDAVEFAVSHPNVVARNVPFLVDAWAFLPQDRETASRRAREIFGDDASLRSGTSAILKRGSALRIELQAGDWAVEPKSQTMVWTGHVTNASFRVAPGTEAPNGIVHAVCKIFLHRARIGEIHFELLLGEKPGERPHVRSAKRLTGFASYASKDRSRVLASIQGIEKFVDVFMDVRNLKAGDPYPTHLLREIDASDVLYLFWSEHARQSEWVNKEWRYGFDRRGIDFIDPVPLVDPRKVPPPPELADKKHFDDWTLAFLEYEKAYTDELPNHLGHDGF